MLQWQPGTTIDADSETVTLDAPLFEGDGAEGVVWSLRPPHHAMLAKLFFAPADRERAVTQLLPRLRRTVGTARGLHIAVPVSMARKAGVFVGVLVPLYDDPPWAPLELMIVDRTADLEARRQIALSLCRTLAAAHEGDFVVGDVAPGNMLVDMSKNVVGIIDVDSWGFRPMVASIESLFAPPTQADIPIPAKKCGPDYRLPNARNLTQESDRFALAIVVVQILTGHHPFGSTKIAVKTRFNDERVERGHNWLLAPGEYRIPVGWISERHPGFAFLPGAAADLARDGLANHQVRLRGRPTADSWIDVLAQMVVVTCGVCGAKSFVAGCCPVCGVETASGHGAQATGPGPSSGDLLSVLNAVARSPASAPIGGSASGTPAAAEVEDLLGLLNPVARSPSPSVPTPEQEPTRIRSVLPAQSHQDEPVPPQLVWAFVAVVCVVAAFVALVLVLLGVL